MMRVAPAFGLLAALTACASPAPQQVNRGHSLPPPAQSRAASVEPNEAVWHLRAGLNVAALSCRGRGRTPVSGQYARLLSRHKGLLAQAYAGEQRRYGAGLDRHQTQLYNRFSNQQNPTKFCAAAASVGARAATMDSPTLAARARSLLGEIG